MILDQQETDCPVSGEAKVQENLEQPASKTKPKGPKPRSNIILIGVMASGKSAVGWRLAQIVGYGFLDVDQWIEKQEKRTIAEIWLNEGEDAFRQKERDAIHRLQSIRNHVIAVGGGAVVDDENWRVLTRLGTTVWLDTPSMEIARRLVMKPDEIAQRPLLLEAANADSKEQRFSMLDNRIGALIQQRRQRYGEADYVLSDSYSTPEASAQLIKGLLKSGGVLH